MKPHKWAKEIKAWADGAEIEWRYVNRLGHKDDWEYCDYPDWSDNLFLFRIKPQPKDSDYISIAKEHYANLRKYEKKLWEEVCVKVMNDFMDGIKPQPKEPQYLYVYSNDMGEPNFFWHKITPLKTDLTYQGKIKLEVDDE